jgi:predicted amidophosphoribosyltransferase
VPRLDALAPLAETTAARTLRRHPYGDQHPVCCPYCARQFDLFAAPWCPHLEGDASKVCPSCQRCLCEHPAYAEPHFWKDAPEAFQRRGFRRLFLFYL